MKRGAAAQALTAANVESLLYAARAEGLDPDYRAPPGWPAEKWAAWPGAPDAYAVSSHGRVLSLDRPARTRGGGMRAVAPRLLKTAPPSAGARANGAACAVQVPGGGRRAVSVALLMLEAFAVERPSPQHVAVCFSRPARPALHLCCWATRAEVAQGALKRGH